MNKSFAKKEQKTDLEGLHKTSQTCEAPVKATLAWGQWTLVADNAGGKLLQGVF